MGAELCLAHDMGGVEAYGGPLSVDMQPYGCFIGIVSFILGKKDDFKRFSSALKSGNVYAKYYIQI